LKKKADFVRMFSFLFLTKILCFALQFLKKYFAAIAAAASGRCTPARVTRDALSWRFLRGYEIAAPAAQPPFVTCHLSLVTYKGGLCPRNINCQLSIA
jgi:hypothetical protein